MERKIELYTIIGLLLAALGCVAAWFALPQFQPFAASLLANPLFWPLLAILGLLALLLPFTDVRALLNRLRSLLPGRGFERAYLQALARHSERLPALLVIGGRDNAMRELTLLTAYSQLSLTTDDGRPVGARLSDDGPERVDLVQRAGRARRPVPATLAQRARAISAWLLAQAAVLVLALLLLYALLRPGILAQRVSWSRGTSALLVVVLWFLLARWLHTAGIPNLAAWWRQRREPTGHPGTPGGEIWQHKRLLIRGAPGSGKTTLLRHIAVVCASERLGLSRRWQRNRVRDAYGWPGAPFPIYIPLRALRLAAVQGIQPLLESYAATLRTVPLLGADLKHCAPDFFVTRAQRGGCIIMLDAFDELRNAEDRRRLGRLIDALPDGPPHRRNRIVVTSRIAGYEGQLDGFVHRHLAELDDAQAAEFIQARYHALAEKERAIQGDSHLRWSPQQRADSLIGRLPDHPGLRRFGRNPLLLSLAVALHYKQDGRELPQERHLLYKTAVEMLTYEWERLKDADAGLDPADESGDLALREKIDMLTELAWAMFEQAPADAADATHAVTTRSHARDVLARVLEGIPGVAGARDAAERTRLCRSEAERWLANLSERGGVLQEIGNVPGSSDSELQFAHLTFQEYLAASAIDQDAAGLRERRLRERWADPRWREVLLLYAAIRPDFTPVVRYLLDQSQLQGQLLAGAVLVERPRRLDQALLLQAREQVEHLALADAGVEPGTALEALKLLEDAAALPDRAALLAAATTAAHPAARARVIELLAGAAPSRPAAQPAPADLTATALQVLAHEPDYRPRLAAGFALAHNDPRYDGAGWLPELVSVPAGRFLMGSAESDTQALSDEQRQHPVDLPAYCIGKTPVTNAQWRRFVDAGGYTTRAYWSDAGWHWRTGAEARPGWRARLFNRGSAQPPVLAPEYWDDSEFNAASQPVVGISWYEAVAYCRWLSAESGQAFYLPSEAEWEYAARGASGQIYPWGDVWQAGCCNSAEAGIGRPSPVGSFPAGVSPYGALDMAGNVWEWCATRYGKPYPYDPSEDEWSNAYCEGDAARRLRGGAYYSDQPDVRGASRYNFNTPRYRLNNIGLRVASRSGRPHAES